MTPLPPEYYGHKYAGEIHVQYSDGPPEESVYEGMTSVLNTYGGVRTFPNEHGQMAAAGLRMDLVSSTLMYHTPKEGNKSQGMSIEMLKHFGVGFIIIRIIKSNLTSRSKLT